jgi:hypothetical protein
MLGEAEFFETFEDRFFYFIFGEKEIKTGFLESLNLNKRYKEVTEKELRREINIRLRYFTRDKLAQ